MKSKAIIILLLLSAQFVNAQKPDSTDNSDGGIDQIIEDAMTDIESDDQTDWTIFTDFLEDLRARPLDLNKATRDELGMLPGLDDILIENLQVHIQKFGPLLSLFELQAVTGFDYETFQRIRPFVTVIGREKDVSERLVHPKGPPLSEIKEGLKHELLLRTTYIVEQEKGFTDPDTTSSGDLTTRYAGSRERMYARYRARYNQNVSIGFVTEKDPGEKYVWDPSTGQLGTDFLSAHFHLKNFGKLKRLSIGDYNMQFGQGMLLSTGLGFGKGSETIRAIKRTDMGIRPYTSVNENQFLRGAAATMGFGPVSVTGFFSRVGKDANIADQDTVTNEIANVSSLQTSGFHRTASEIEDRRALLETMYGARVDYRKSRFRVGALHFFQNFNTSLAPTGKDYQLYDFSGDANYLSSLDFDWTFRNFNFFGEVGRSKSGGMGMIGGFMGSIDPKVDISVLARKFDADFHSFRGFVFAERPTAIRNETGLYTGIQIRPNTKWLVSGYVDQFWFPWHRFNVSYPSQGQEYMVQIDYRPKRSMWLYARWRSDHKQRNAQDPDNLETLQYIVPTAKRAIRLHFQKSFDRVFTVRTRMERSWYRQGEQENSTGFLLYQDLVWKVNWKFDITMRYAIFDVTDYNARIYAFENDVLGFFSIPAYSDKGSRYYLVLNYKPSRNVEFWLRLAQWHYRHEKTVGSGLGEINGDTKTEVKFQVRFRL